MNAADCRLIALLVAGTACSRSADSPPPGESPARDSAAAPIYGASDLPHDPGATRLCGAVFGTPAARRAACCNDTTPDTRLLEQCVGNLSASLSAGAVVLDDAALAQCERQVDATTAGCDWVTPRSPPPPHACRRIVTGRLEAGAVCRSSLECRTSLSCFGVGPTARGICRPPAPEGAACNTSVDPLEATTGQLDSAIAHPPCVGFCLHRRCAATARRGEACSDRWQCESGSRCLGGRCVPGARSEIGSACSATSPCVEEARCDAGTCVALGATGAPCSSPFACRAACVRQPGATTGVCGKQCALGAP